MPEKAKKTLTFTPTGDEGPVEKTPNAQGGYTLTESELDSQGKSQVKPKVGPYVVDTPEKGEPEVSSTNSKAMRQDMMTNPEAYGVKVGNSTMPGVGNITPEREQKWANSMKAEKDYGADWTKGFNKNTLRDSKLTLGEALASYKRYKAEHPEAPELDMVDFYTTLKDKDLSKSMSDNEKDEAKAKNDEKWENIQNALFSFADLYSAAKGAPVPENAETPEQLTKRQEERRDKVKAMRDKDWQTYMALYQKQQADDLAKRKLANQEAKQQADQDFKRQQMDIKVKEAAAKRDLNALKAQLDEAKLEGMRAKNEADKKLWNLKAKQIEAQIKYTNERSRGGNTGKPTYETTTTTTVTEGYDADNNKTKTTTKSESKHPVGSGGKAKKTPPSRSNTQSKTPPSRRQ